MKTSDSPNAKLNSNKAVHTIRMQKTREGALDSSVEKALLFDPFIGEAEARNGKWR